MRQRYISLCSAAAAAALLCTTLTGCSEDSKKDGIWTSIDQTDSGEFGEAKYEDGTYLTEEVREPAPDPYAGDTQKVSDGQTADGILYAVYEKHVEITGHSPDFNTEYLTVPAEIEGKPVSRIASAAVSEENRFEGDVTGGFSGCYSLLSVTLPDTLTEIGDYAFYGCKNMRTAEIPESVTVIGARAFSMCRNLVEMSVPTGIGSIGDSAFAQTPWYDNLLFHKDFVIFNGRLYDAGHRCTGYVTVPDYVVSIEDYAFFSCTELKTVTVPASVQKIGKCAFCDCPSLSTVLIENPDCEICDEAMTVCNRFADEDYCYNGTIRGESGSSAEAYAKKYGYRFSTEAPPPDEELPPETTAPAEETGTTTTTEAS